MNHAISFESFDDLFEHEYFHKNKSLFPEKNLLMYRNESISKFRYVPFNEPNLDFSFLRFLRFKNDELCSVISCVSTFE